MANIETNSRKILIVDEDRVIRSGVRGRLAEEGFHTDEAENTTQALNKILANTYDLVITNARMTAGPLDGLGLLKQIKSQSQTRVVAITGCSNPSEAKAAIECGADVSLSKPFHSDDLVNTVRRLFGMELLTEQNPSDFVAVAIGEFLSGNKIRCDIYVRLTGNRFIKVARKGDVLSLECAKKYQLKGVTHLHLKKEDFREYMMFSVGLTSIACSKKIVPQNKVKSLILHSAEMIGRHICHDELDQQSLACAKETLKNTIEVIATDEDFHLVLEQLSTHQDALYAHSLGVSLYALMIARSIGWVSQGVLGQVALAGLFHDVGKKELPVELLNKPRTRMNVQDTRLYQSHISRSIEILNGMGGIPEVIIQAVAQHHEDLTGTGFPNFLRKPNISPMGQLLAVADSFAKLVISNNHQARLSASEAIKRMRILQKESLNAEYVDALSRCLNAEVAVLAA